MPHDAGGEGGQLLFPVSDKRSKSHTIIESLGGGKGETEKSYSIQKKLKGEKIPWPLIIRSFPCYVEGGKVFLYCSSFFIKKETENRLAKLVVGRSTMC